MLTARLGRLRDWTLFSAAALAPAVAVGALGLRAMANEEAGARREVGLGLTAGATAISRDLEQAMGRATTDLEALALDPDAGQAAVSLARVAPRFALPVLLASDRSVVLPLAPATLAEPSAKVADCRQRASVLGMPRPRDEEQASLARHELLAECPEVRSPSGRFLWPVVALDPGSRGQVSEDSVATWIEAHGSRLGDIEREATRLDVSRSLHGDAAERALRALGEAARESATRALGTRPGSRRDAVVAALASPGAVAALRSPVARTGLVTWRSEASAGTLRVLDDGRLVGWIVDASSLEGALTAHGIAVPEGMVALVERGRQGHEQDAAGRLAAFATIAPELALRVVPKDPSAVARHAARSRYVLAGLGSFAMVAAFALAALLFTRMRAARRSSALRTDFVAAVSHELRTPIASMRMLAELLEEDRVEPEERREVFVALAREARRLGETVDRLLGFSRMAAGRHVLDRTEVRVAEVAAQAVDTFEERHADEPKVERSFDEAAVAWVDAGQLRLALDNLLANARKHAPEGSPYRVSVERDTAGVALRVADHGPGIARRDRRRIFEPFERADDRLSRATEGSGIGLSLVQHVARAHGGRATVESEVGRGAVFTLWLPSNEERFAR